MKLATIAKLSGGNSSSSGTKSLFAYPSNVILFGTNKTGVVEPTLAVFPFPCETRGSPRVARGRRRVEGRGLPEEGGGNMDPMEDEEDEEE